MKKKNIKKHTVSFTFETEEEYELYRGIAQEMGCPLSVLARMAMKEYCRRRKKLTDKER